MATTGAQPWDVPVPVEDIEDSAPTACWAVEEKGWKDLVPDLPDDMIDLLAPPVVVSAAGIEPSSAAGARASSTPAARLLVPGLSRRLRRSV
jgi:hypothetical protein